MSLIECDTDVSAKLQIGMFVFDPVKGSITNDATCTRLEPQTADFLSVLASNPNHTVSREMLLAEVWANRQVSDDAIRAVVRKLRFALGDDAKNPSYIKTIPLKGYRLIAQVQELKPASDKSVFRPGLKYLLTGLLVAAVASAFLLSALSKSTHTGIARPPTVTLLTHMQGSELSPDYNYTTNMLVFSHRVSSESPMQLFARNLTTSKVQRLTWDNANYANAMWSHDGKSLIYTRSSPNSIFHYFADFDPVDGLRSVRKLDHSNLKNKFIAGWSADSQSFYLKDGYQKNKSQGISQFGLQTGKLKSITAPTVAGRGDFYAKESFDGRLLAILRAVDTNKNELLVLDISSGALLLNRVLPFDSNRLVWTSDNLALVLSGFKGGMFKYEISLDRFFELPITLDYTNDVFFHCGENCVFARQHNGNYLDIQEMPNPFLSQSLLATDYLELPGADDLPVYSKSGEALYFISANADGIALNRQTRLSSLERIAHLGKEDVFTSMQVNDRQTAIVGTLGNRIFVLEIEIGQITYITSGLEQASNPVWYNDSDTIVFSTYEKGKYSIYRHKLRTNKRDLIAEDYLALRQINDTSQVAIDPDLNAWLLTDGEAPGLVATLQSASPNRWKVIDGKLFYTTRKGTESFLSYSSLSPGGKDTRALGKNQFKLNFDIHPSGKKLSVVKSRLAESNIVKISVFE